MSWRLEEEAFWRCIAGYYVGFLVGDWYQWLWCNFFWWRALPFVRLSSASGFIVVEVGFTVFGGSHFRSWR